MTMIDPTMGWFEIKEVDNIDAAHAQAALDDTWLCLPQTKISWS
jgi:hypothetical protein